MKRCIETHTVASFGEIPEGSLWDDDSPYVVEADRFVKVEPEPVVKVEVEPKPTPAPKPARRKES